MLTLMLLPVPELVRLAVEGGRVVLHPRPDGQHAHGHVHGMKVQRRRVRLSQAVKLCHYDQRCCTR